MQYGKTWRTIAKLSLPDKYLRDTADDAPETRSERMFAELEPASRAPIRPPAASRAEDGDRRGAAVAAASKRAAKAAATPRRPGSLKTGLAGYS